MFKIFILDDVVLNLKFKKNLGIVFVRESLREDYAKQSQIAKNVI